MLLMKWSYNWLANLTNFLSRSSAKVDFDQLFLLSLVRSRWIPNCRIEKYNEDNIPAAIINEMAKIVHKYRRRTGDGDGGDIIQTIQHLSDCTGESMEYVVIRHDQLLENDEGTSDEHARTTYASSNPARRDGTCCDTAVQACNQSEQVRYHNRKVVKRRSRRPTTSMLSEHVWREMRKQLSGHEQHDGVTW